MYCESNLQNLARQSKSFSSSRYSSQIFLVDCKAIKAEQFYVVTVNNSLVKIILITTVRTF